MNVSELYRLAEWFEGRYQELSSLYQQLMQPLQHNATQPEKQPLGPNLYNLMAYLGDMTFETLSLQQIWLLEELGVYKYIGPAGRDFVDATVRTSDFDPATAVQKIQEAIDSINSARQRLISYRDSVNALDIDLLDFDEPDDLITIRIGFQNDAAIENIADWRTSAREWYEIIRGLAMAANEPPENTKVVGAASGSIILFLAATVSVTTLLAIISKNVTGVAKDVISVQSEIENLRAKKLLTKLIETDLKKQMSAMKENALNTVMGEIKKRLPKIDGEASSALEKSIDRLLTFNEKGGNVDFVTPESLHDESDSEKADFAALSEAKAAIQEYQAMRDEVKLLTDASNDD